MSNKKTAQELADELGKIFQSYVDSLEIDEFYAHFSAELRIVRKNREHNVPSALSDQKIAMLEKAVEEFKMVYDAEKAEAEKMPLSWHEARRVLKLFEVAEDRFNPPPVPPVEH